MSDEVIEVLRKLTLIPLVALGIWWLFRGLK